MGRLGQLLNDCELGHTTRLLRLSGGQGVAAAILHDGKLETIVLEADNYGRWGSVSSLLALVDPIAGFNGVLNLQNHRQVAAGLGSSYEWTK